MAGLGGSSQSGQTVAELGECGLQLDAAGPHSCLSALGAVPFLRPNNEPCFIFIYGLPESVPLAAFHALVPRCSPPCQAIKPKAREQIFPPSQNSLRNQMSCLWVSK